MGDFGAVIGDLGTRIERATPAERDAMLAELAELFQRVASSLPGSGIDTFDAVFVSLMASCSASARAKLSERLAPAPRAPQRVILRLAFDDNILVARPILRLSPLLLDEQLLAIATVKSADHLLAICERPEIGTKVTDVILSRADGAVTVALASNPGARFSPAGQARLIAQALDNGELYDIVSERADLAEEIRRLEDDQADPPAPPETIVLPGTVQTRVLAHLEAGKIEDALAELSRDLGVPREPVVKAFKVDVFGGFLAYAKAAKLDWSAMRMFGNLRHQGGAPVPLLKRAEEDFAALTIPEARRVVNMLVAHGGAEGLRAAS